MNSKSRDPRPYASPPCMAGELSSDYFGSSAVDPQQAVDVARWRKAERTRLRTERMSLEATVRRSTSEKIIQNLQELFANQKIIRAGSVVSMYWPIKGELDIRPLMEALHGEGILVALPVVETKAAPLVFRRWMPDTRMERGYWNILVPPTEAQILTPDAMLVPLVGWDMEGYRLGYGGGYFDRTLATLSPPPFSIGIGLQSAQLATIYPQPHDIPLNLILTEAGLQSDLGG